MSKLKKRITLENMEVLFSSILSPQKINSGGAEVELSSLSLKVKDLDFDIIESAVQEVIKDKLAEGKVKKLSVYKAIKDDTDRDGNVRGKKIVVKKDKWLTPILVDSLSQPLATDPFSGSIVDVVIGVKAYATPALGVGASLTLEQLMVQKPAERKSNELKLTLKPRNDLTGTVENPF